MSGPTKPVEESTFYFGMNVIDGEISEFLGTIGYQTDEELSGGFQRDDDGNLVLVEPNLLKVSEGVMKLPDNFLRGKKVKGKILSHRSNVIMFMVPQYCEFVEDEA